MRKRLLHKGPSIKDVSPKGEGGGTPKTETLGDGGSEPLFGVKETSFILPLNSDKKFPKREKILTSEFMTKT